MENEYELDTSVKRPTEDKALAKVVADENRIARLKANEYAIDCIQDILKSGFGIRLVGKVWLKTNDTDRLYYVRLEQ